MDQDFLLNHHQQQQHDDTYNLDKVINRLSTMANPVLAPNGAPIYRVERGGEVTFHGPSILCVYPMMNLERPPYKPDLHWFLRMIEEVSIQTLDHYGIHGAYRDHVNTGVWIKDENTTTTTTKAPDGSVGRIQVVSENKVVAVGVTASRWITTHGFAINIDPDLSWFDTSIILQHSNLPTIGVPTTREVASVVVQKMQTVFDIDHVVPGHNLY
jgi:lipoyl(octanoyl) transferase